MNDPDHIPITYDSSGWTVIESEFIPLDQHFETIIERQGIRKTVYFPFPTEPGEDVTIKI